MFILDITYTAPVERVDALLADHLAWLERGRDAGQLVGWGRKVPRSGGIVFAVGDRPSVEALANSDPYVTGGVATVVVTEFAGSYAAEGLEGLSR